jgi:peptidoglycan/LPS O-acetylase OafA/YrhL
MSIPPEIEESEVVVEYREGRSTSSDRIGPLDGLRAVAALSVLIHHIAGNILPGGYIGVDLFFVISGYIISASLLTESEKTGTISISGFYKRRVVRILPALVATIAGAVLLATAFPAQWARSGTIGTDVALALLSATNWRNAFLPDDGSLLSHTWSLGIEEQFYLFWPLCLLLLLRGKKHVTTWLFLALAAVTLWRMILFVNDASHARIYNGFDTRADALLIGCVMAKIGIGNLPSWLLRPWQVPTMILAVILLFVPGWWRIMDGPGLTITAFASAWLIACAIGNKSTLSRMLSHRYAQWVGLRSYSIYLWHVPILLTLREMQWQLRILGPAVVVATLVAAHLSYELVEQPVQRWFRSRRDRLERLEAHAAP